MTTILSGGSGNLALRGGGGSGVVGTPTPVARKTYNAADFPGATPEARIDAMLAKCLTDVVKLGHIPAAFLPYDVSLLTNLAAFSASGGRLVAEGYDAGVYHIDAYGASAANTAAKNDASIAAALAAAYVTFGNVRASGVTYQTSDRVYVTQPISFRGAGLSATVFYRQNLTGPVVELNIAVKGADVGDFETLYSADPGAGDVNASGLRLTSFFQSKLTNVQMLRSYIAFEVPGQGSAAVFFSNTIDNIVMRDVYQSFIKVHVGSSGANTGHDWGNIYCNGRAYNVSTVKNVNGPAVQLSTSDGESFQQLNIEYVNVTAAVPRLIQIERGAMVFNHVHLEGIQSDAFANLDLFACFPGASNKVALVINSLQLNAMSLGNISSWTNLVQLGGDNISVLLNGFVEKQGGSTFGGNGLRPAWSNGSRAGCSFMMNEWQSPSLALNTSGLASSTAPIAHIPLYGSAVLNFAAPGAVPGETGALTITVTGAALGDLVEVSAAITKPANFAAVYGWVSAANTVSVAWLQFAGGAADPDGAGTTYFVKVIKR